MKTIIAGSRDVSDIDFADVEAAVEESGFSISIVVSGGAKGVDKLGEKYAYKNNLPLMVFDVTDEHIKRYGQNYAFIKRNEEMAKFADALILVWKQGSSGSKNMMETASEENLCIYTKTIGGYTIDDF